MAKVWMSWLVALVLCVMCSTVWGTEAADPGGLTVWGLGGNGFQMGRVGWLFEKWAMEPAIGVKHSDAMDDENVLEEWPIRGYLIFHGLDTEMLLRAFKWEMDLPDGVLYIGPLAQYSNARPDEEWAFGLNVGVLIDLGSLNAKWAGWSAATEYEWLIGNVDKKERVLSVGLCRRFQ